MACESSYNFILSRRVGYAAGTESSIASSRDKRLDLLGASCVACRAPDGHFSRLSIQDTNGDAWWEELNLVSTFSVLRRCSRRGLRSGAVLPVPTEMLKGVDNMRMRMHMHTCKRTNSISSNLISSLECCCELRLSRECLL